MLFILAAAFVLMWTVARLVDGWARQQYVEDIRRQQAWLADMRQPPRHPVKEVEETVQNDMAGNAHTTSSIQHQPNQSRRSTKTT